MNIKNLNATARQLVMPGKGILAADESTGTIEKRLTKVNVASTEENRRAYRELLFTAPDIGKYISGVIMYDETIRQKSSDGKSFVSILQNEGVIPGIKVDQSTYEMPGSQNEKLTKGLDGLPERLKEYANMGAKFAKWRAVITIGPGTPTDANIEQNAKDLAIYAKMCQDAGIIPIVEPEVLMDGNHSMERCAEVSEKVLTTLFRELHSAGVTIEGTILKTNMVIPAKQSEQKKTAGQIADATVVLFKKVLPKELPGQVFLSGGQNEVEATANLNAINQHGPFPWKLSFSYGRALQDSVLKTWGGDANNVSAAQKVFLHRAKMNSLATLGKYTLESEHGN